MRGFWIYQGSEYPSGFEDARVLNIPRFWICLWFWICQGSEYTRVLNMSGLHSVLNIPDYVWLNMPRYIWICRNMRECAQTCLNGFCIVFPHCNPLSTWTRAYFQRLHKTRRFSLKENDAVFLETQNLIFSIAAVILFSFCFRLNVFTSKISNLLLPLGAEWVGVVNLDIPYLSLLLLVTFLLEHNVDEKNMRNIDIRIHVKLEVKCQSRFF